MMSWIKELDLTFNVIKYWKNSVSVDAGTKDINSRQEIGVTDADIVVRDMISGVVCEKNSIHFGETKTDLREAKKSLEAIYI